MFGRDSTFPLRVELGAMLIWILISGTGEACGASFVVNNNLDTGPGSLRQAITDANSAGGSIITFSNVSGAIPLMSPLPAIEGSLQIRGPGMELLTISGQATVRVFQVSAPANVTISDLTIANGRTFTDAGGGIWNAGNLILSNCTVFSNKASRLEISPVPGTVGGGIYTSGRLTLIEASVWGNQSRDHGGGIYIASGDVFVTNSMIFSNSCIGHDANQTEFAGHSGSGGGIAMRNGALTVFESIVSENFAFGSAGPPAFFGRYGRGGGSAFGGGVFADGGRMDFVSCTLSSNVSQGGGGSSGGLGSGSGGSAYGGAFWTTNCPVSMTNCVINGNRAVGGPAGGANAFAGRGFGNGIYNIPPNVFALKNSFLTDPSVGVTVIGWPVFLSELESKSQWLGYGVVFSGSVTGTPPMSFEWRHDGSVIRPFGEGLSELFLPSVQPEDAGTYVLTVTNNYGAVTSRVVNLAVVYFSLTVNAGTGGSIFRSLDATNFAPYSEVILTPIPEADFGFRNWSGDASGTTNHLHVVMNANKTITGNFVRRSRLSGALGSEGTGSFHLTLEGLVGETYDISASTDLIHWTSIATLTNSLGIMEFTDESSTNLLNRFYRALLVP